MVAKAERRRFTAEYKAKVLREADSCKQPGEIGALLRREGLYWSNLTTWRKQRESGELAGLTGKKRGPQRREKNPLAERVRELERDNARLKRRAERAEGIVELQKKVSEILGIELAKERRDRLMGVVGENKAKYSVESICAGLGIGRASYYRWQRPSPGAVTERIHPRALSVNERQDVLGVVNSERFCDQAPGEIYATLLDEGKLSVLGAHDVPDLGRPISKSKNEEISCVIPVIKPLSSSRLGQNEVWSWDITKLLGPTKWTYFYLYVILDIFSRYVVGWMLAYRESAELAKKLIEQTIERHNIEPGCLTVHADRGAPMTSKAVAFLLAGLGVTKTHSRPYVSNDNPYSESQFKTMKYRPRVSRALWLLPRCAPILHRVFPLVQPRASSLLAWDT